MNIDLLISGALNIACFLIGAKIGAGKTIERPKMKIQTPAKLIREHKDARAKELEQKRDAVMLSNIDVYDGTGSGQQDIPEEVR